MIKLPIVIGEMRLFSPPVFRYMDSLFVDNFLSNGMLRLSSVKKFKKHTDEQRFDGLEGKTMFTNISEEGGGQTFIAYTRHGEKSYVLSTSMLLDNSLLSDFSCNSVLKILNPLEFCNSISKQIPGLIYSSFGPCYYMPKKNIGIDMGLIDIDKARKNRNKFSQATLSQAGDKPLYLKSIDYSHQCEFRFFWATNKETEDYIDITAVDATKYCRKIEVDGFQLGTHTPKKPEPLDFIKL